MLLNDGVISVHLVGTGNLARLTQHRPEVRDEILERYLISYLKKFVADHFGISVEELKVKVVLTSVYNY